jgi:hypothetical protein
MSKEGKKELQIKDVFPETSFIKTRHINTCDWVSTVILRNFNEFFEIKQTKEYLEKILMINDEILCKRITDEYIYEVEARVVNIKFSTRSIVLKAINLERIPNNRNYRRFDVFISSSFNCKNVPMETYAVVTDISEYGLSMITTEKLEIDESVNLSLYLSNFNEIFMDAITKSIKKIHDKYTYGLYIQNMIEFEKDKYLTYLSKLQKAEDKILKNNAQEHKRILKELFME